MKSIPIIDIARYVNGVLIGAKDLHITGFSGLELAKQGDLSFLVAKKYEACLSDTKASAVLVPDHFDPLVYLNHRGEQSRGGQAIAFIKVSNPSRALNDIIKAFVQVSTSKFETMIASGSVVSKQAVLGKGVQVGHNAVIEEGAVIGDDTVIGANCYIGRNVSIGKHSRLFPNVVLLDDTVVGNHVIIQSGSVIGSDGFGYDSDVLGHTKVPHIGHVIIEDEVEIGALVSVDRARLNFTLIERGVKIDNLVHIAHNVTVGEHSMLLAQSGIAGSASLGRRVILAGQSGVVGHIHVGEGAIIASRSGASKNVDAHQVISGFPGRAHMEQKKMTAMLHKLPEIAKKIRKIEQYVFNPVDKEK